MKLPVEFEQRMRISLGEEYQAFENALNETSPTSIRLNPFKIESIPNLEKVKWCDTGYYLPERPLFASDPLWHAGAYYVQEASSMLIESAFKKVKDAIDGPLKVLDLCAAPGGKSTHLASMLDENDLLVANEVIRSRVPVLTENLIKHGYPNIVITNSDSADFEKTGGIFDLILVDAPCSGEGLFRKDHDAINEWSPENIQTCELRQKRILENMVKCVKPGGFIIYSTCTYNPGENEKQVELMISKGFELQEFNVNGRYHGCFQALPHQLKGEGFFIALLKNTNDTEAVASDGKEKLKPVKKDSLLTRLMLSELPVFDFKGSVIGIPQHVFDFYDEYLLHLSIAHIGVNLGFKKAELFNPSEYLPFSLNFNLEAFDSLELDLEQSLSYLSKNSITNRETAKRGHVILRFEQLPIGLGKFAGNRINNLFPNEWRLRKMPDDARKFSLISILNS